MAGINPKLIERVVESIRFANQKFGVSFLVIEAQYRCRHRHLRAHRRARPGAQARRRDTRRNRSATRAVREAYLVVDPNLPTKSLSIKGLRAGYGSLDILTASTSTCRRGSSSP